MELTISKIREIVDRLPDPNRPTSPPVFEVYILPDSEIKAISMEELNRPTRQVTTNKLEFVKRFTKTGKYEYCLKIK